MQQNDSLAGGSFDHSSISISLSSIRSVIITALACSRAGDAHQCALLPSARLSFCCTPLSF